MHRFLWASIVAVLSQIVLSFWMLLDPPGGDPWSTARALLQPLGIMGGSVILGLLAREVRHRATELRAVRIGAAVIVGLSVLAAVPSLASPVLYLLQRPEADFVAFFGLGMARITWLAVAVTGLLALSARPRPVVPAMMAVLVFLLGITTEMELPYNLAGPASEPDTSYLIRAQGGEVRRGRILGLTVWSGPATVADYLFTMVLPDRILVPKPPATDLAQRNAMLDHMMVNSESMAKAVGLQLMGRGKGATFKGTGVVVSYVAPGTPAAAAFQIGDLIVGLNGAPVTSWTQLQGVLRDTRPGVQLSFAVKRDGKPQTLTLTTVPNPSNPEQGRVGFQGSDEVHYDIPVPITTAIPPDVAGPSMGLALTLQVVDQLTPGGITGDWRVAATGEILPGGAVGPVGSLQYKARGAERAGANVLFVPRLNYQEALSGATRIQVVPVDTVQDVLAWLKTH